MLLIKLAEFFQEDNGRLSNTRFNATLIIMAGIIYPYLAGRLDDMVITYSLGLVVLGMGGKLIGKVSETKAQDATDK